MYRKILVPLALDHGISPNTLAIAQLLAGKEGEITALHVYETAPATVGVFLDEALVKKGFEYAKQQLNEKTAGFENTKTVMIKGHTYRAIVDYATDNEVDCIVMGSHKPGLSDYLLGSTAARVVRHAPCAVHVHR